MSSGRIARGASAVLVILLGVPVVGVVLGGLYAIPAMWLTRSKDPQLTLLLCCCLAAPVGAVGFAFGTPRSWMLVHWLVMVIALLLRRMSGPLGGNVERFGIVNAVALLVGVAAGLASRADSVRQWSDDRSEHVLRGADRLPVSRVCAAGARSVERTMRRSS